MINMQFSFKIFSDVALLIYFMALFLEGIEFLLSSNYYVIASQQSFVTEMSQDLK